MSRTKQYVRVYVTPLANNLAYQDNEIEITDYIIEDGVSEIREFIDSEDYDFGLFSFADVDIQVDNHNGKLGPPNDSRSIFTHARDLAKLRVVFCSEDTVGESITETTVFRGLINDEASVSDFQEGTITLTALSMDSILGRVILDNGFITDGTLASEALLSVLSIEKIATVFSVDASDINVGLDFTIEDASPFANISARDAIAMLLFASNSVLLFSDAQEAIVQERTVNDIDPHYFYGGDALTGRENVLAVQNYNDGRQRMFNSVKINGDIEQKNLPFIAEFGLRQKTADIDFIVDTEIIGEIATTLLDQFKAPKVELELQHDFSNNTSIRLLDPASVDIPLRLVPIPGTFMFIFDQSIMDDDDEQMPEEVGAFKIDANIKFKVIERRLDPSTFVQTLKLRQDGTELEDGYF